MTVNSPHPQQRRVRWAAALTSVLLITFVIQGMGQYSTQWFAVDNVVEKKKTSRQIDDISSKTLLSTTAASSFPRIAWIMSIGASGTSYTINNLEAITNTTTATNYREYQGNCQRVPTIYQDATLDKTNGPCLHRADLKWPRRYILTKTHCTAYGMRSAPRDYVLNSSRVFAHACASGITRDHKNAAYHYDNAPHTVHKAVHMIRDPFDTLVGRWHLAQKRIPKLKRQSSAANTSSLPNATVLADFSNWCRYLDDRAAFEELQAQKLFPPGFGEHYQHVPCHVEWFRYIQWHNMAYWVTRHDWQIPVHYLHYERYSSGVDDNAASTYNQTMQQLLQFLEFDSDTFDRGYGRHKPFWAGKSYHNLFDAYHVMAAKSMVRELALEAVWERLKHYFDVNENDSVAFTTDAKWRAALWPEFDQEHHES